MNFDEQVSIIEAILFASGDPISAAKLSEASGIGKAEIPRLVDILNAGYKKSKSALFVIVMDLNGKNSKHAGDKSFQMGTLEKYAPYIKKALESRRNAPLSAAAMEVLSVIAYNQPVTKGFVEHVRGIDSSSIVNNLVERGLVEEAGRLELPGRPVSFKTTPAFLRCFKLSSLEGLPSLPGKNEQLDLEDLDIIDDDDMDGN